MLDQLPTYPNGEGLCQLGLCSWWLGGRSEGLRHSSCESGVSTRGPDACVCTSPATVLAAEEYVGDPVFLGHQYRECTGLLVCFNIVRGDGGGRSTDGAAGSKAVVCAQFEMTTVLAICASLAGADFRVHLDCRRAKSSAMSRQRSSKEDSSRLTLMSCCCFQSVTRLRTFKPH